jgi:hypothetical protein
MAESASSRAAHSPIRGHCHAAGGWTRPHAKETADAAVSADAGVDLITVPLVDLVRYEISLYDRRIRAMCPCLVAKGEYETEQDCLDLGLSGPDWQDCASMALASYDNPMTRAQTSCYFDFLEQTAECVESSQCDDARLASCGTPDSECLSATNERLQLLLAACPSLGLLSRLK